MHEWLQTGPITGQVLAVFARTCDLLLPQGEVVALVPPDVGNGPFNVVVPEPAELWAFLEPGAAATLTSESISAGGLTVALGQASIWEPRPDWERWRAYRLTILSRLGSVRATCLAVQNGPPSYGKSLLALLNPPAGPLSPSQQVAREALRELEAGWAGDSVRLREGTGRLAGLGAGLTPSGDDLLVGVMLWAWLAHPTPAALGREIVAAAAGRTTVLSAAFLRAAARGECSDPWHALLETLATGQEITAATRGILAHGATSGADALAGFLWAGALPPV